MTLQELRNLVRTGEGQHLEFKKKADHPDKIVKEMVAFSNSGGGILLLGVDDRGGLTGLRDTEEERYVMEAALHRYARPALRVIVETIPVENHRSVLAFRVADGPEKPYYWLSDPEKEAFRVYVRHRDQSLKASAEMYRILRRGAGGDPTGLRFSETEKRLFQALGEREWLGLREFGELSGLSRRKASAMVIDWVRGGILKIEPGEKEDRFRLTAAYRPAD